MTMAQREAFDSLLPRPHRFHFVCAVFTGLAVLGGLILKNPGMAVVQAVLCMTFIALGLAAMRRRERALELIESFEDESKKS